MRQVRKKSSRGHTPRLQFRLANSEWLTASLRIRSPALLLASFRLPPASRCFRSLAVGAIDIRAASAPTSAALLVLVALFNQVLELSGNFQLFDSLLHRVVPGLRAVLVG